MSKWKMMKLQDISKIINGYSFKSVDFSQKNSIKSIKITNVGVQEFIETNSDFLPEDFSEKYKNFQIPENSIVIALTRSIISDGLKVALVPEKYKKALLNQRVAGIISDQKYVLNKYLFLYLCTQDVLDYVRKQANTLMQPNLSLKALQNLFIPVPPLEEQKRIVEMLDESFAGIERAEVSARQNLTNTRELFDSYLNKVFTDFVERKNTQTLNCITDLIVDCEHKTAPTQETGFPSIRTPNIGKGHLILDNVYRVSAEVYEQWTRRAKPQPGDLILAREAPAGNIGVIPEGERVCLGQRTVLIRPKKNINSQYLAFFLLHPKMQERLLSKSSGATVQHVNMKDIRTLKIGDLPPIEIQDKLIQSLLDVQEKSKKLEKIYQRKIEALGEFKQSILQKAFSGQLTQ